MILLGTMGSSIHLTKQNIQFFYKNLWLAEQLSKSYLQNVQRNVATEVYIMNFQPRTII